MIGKKGMINMDRFTTWSDVKDSMTSLTEEEKIEVDLISEIITQIIKRRQELGMSQRDLEKFTGIKQEAICRIEKMKNVPQLDTLIKIMEPLGLKLTVVQSA
jgi:ribosome-binding protein aMBF1 (putative translation factor)